MDQSRSRRLAVFVAENAEQSTPALMEPTIMLLIAIGAVPALLRP
jgi:hypothetical protein